MGIFDGIDGEQAERIKKELTREVRRDLSEELTATIRARVERDVRAETRRELERERAARAPSPEDRAAFLALIRDVQLDSHAQASIASRAADHAEAALSRSRRLRTPASYAMTIVAPIAIALIVSWTGGFGGAFSAACGSFVLALLALLVSTARRHARLESRFKRERKTASDFLIIAERAKAYQMVHAERIESAVELHELLEALRLDKERLDRTNHLSATELEREREAVRYRIELPRLSEDAALSDEEEDAEASSPDSSPRMLAR